MNTLDGSKVPADGPWVALTRHSVTVFTGRAPFRRWRSKVFWRGPLIRTGLRELSEWPRRPRVELP